MFINGFNIGRYWNRGPQKTLYVPAPLLKSGKNEVRLFLKVTNISVCCMPQLTEYYLYLQILIFELHQPHSDVTLLNKALLH